MGCLWRLVKLFIVGAMLALLLGGVAYYAYDRYWQDRWSMALEAQARIQHGMPLDQALTTLTSARGFARHCWTDFGQHAFYYGSTSIHWAKAIWLNEQRTRGGPVVGRFNIIDSAWPCGSSMETQTVATRWSHDNPLYFETDAQYDNRLAWRFG